MRQSWVDLLFAHWRVDHTLLRAAVPQPLELDLFEENAWVGVVPFAIRDLGIRNLPGIPTATNFLELNVRTYVRYNGKPGVYFFTLEASSALAVTAARTGFGLPYHDAQMQMKHNNGWIEYISTRSGGETDRAFSARYRPVGDPSEPQNGSLEHFLTERYALFTVSDENVSRVDIHHAPWPLQKAECEIAQNSIIQTANVPQPSEAPLLHFSARQDVVNWAPARA
jgi:uncharacterized protein YqjF (DUF2071 family)